jgi:peptidyl-prolyl cis-trans isomerase B (cyclophilin B)
VSGTSLAYAAVLRPLTLLLCALLLGLGLVACGDDDDSDGGAGTASETAEPTDAAPEDGGGGGACAEVEQPAAKPDGGAEKPSQALDPGATYDVVLKTSCGDITIRLDQKTSPKTAASFVELARSGFLDDTVFHRIVPGFVIQGGDPTGTGTGGPGYSTRDTPPKDTVYTKGVVAMAKTEIEPAGTAGSQFYIVTAPDAGLPPDYAVLGEVTEGQDVADAIGQLGDPASGGAGTPLQPVVIERAVVRER